jgi:hypothetical protein
MVIVAIAGAATSDSIATMNKNFLINNHPFFSSLQSYTLCIALVSLLKRTNRYITPTQKFDSDKSTSFGLGVSAGRNSR